MGILLVVSSFVSFQEIYPPKLHQFAYVTDGACSGDEILTMELIIMKVCYKLIFQSFSKMHT